jgi:hypothetical protein
MADPANGWEVVGLPPELLHVIPINDLREHLADEACWCGPTTDGDGIMVHNSMDKREYFERGERRPT